MFAPRHIVPHLKKSDKVVDARAGCGTRVCYLSSLLKQATASQKRIVKKKNKPEELIVPKIFAFENRTGRLETLKARIVNQNEESSMCVYILRDP